MQRLVFTSTPNTSSYTEVFYDNTAGTNFAGYVFIQEVGTVVYVIGKNGATVTDNVEVLIYGGNHDDQAQLDNIELWAPFNQNSKPIVLNSSNGALLIHAAGHYGFRRANAPTSPAVPLILKLTYPIRS